MILKPIQLVLDSSGNQIDLNYRPIRSHTNYRHIIQIVAPNLATEACDVTVSTYGKEIISKTVRTRLAVDANGTYLKGSAVVDSDESYYSTVSEYNVWEVELVGTVASILQKINSSKISIVVSFSMPVVDSRALVNVGSFGSLGDLPAITTETEGDYRVCDSLTYTSTRISTEFMYNDIAIYDGTSWIKGKVFRMIQTCPMIQLSVDPSLALLYDEIDDDLTETLISDVARVDGIVSDVQTKINTVLADNLNINNDMTNLEAEDVLIKGRLDILEAEDIALDGRLDTLEAADIAVDERIDILETEIDLNTAKISFDSTSSAKLATIETGAQVNVALASQAEAEAGVDNTKTMTPLRVAQAIAALVSDSGDVLTTLSLVANTLTYTDENGTPTNIDLSLYLDDTNLARIISGTYDINTNKLVFTRDDESTFSIDASMFFDDTNLVTSVNGEVGAVTLNSDDIPEGTTNLYADANATNQGNTFNGNSQLVKTTAEGKLPALDGSNLTNLPAAGASALDELTDVVITSPTTGQVIKYDGSNWVNGSDNIGEGGGVDTVNGESGTVTLDSDDIDEGTTNLYYTEARVSANSDVAANTAKVSFDSTSSAKLATIAEGAQVNVALATKAEAEAGTEATKTMTALRVAQAIEAQAITSETNTTLTLTANTLTYTNETGTPTNIDLSLYLDDTNLARIISGTYNSELQTLVFTRDDESTFSIDASMFLDDTNLVTSVNGETGAVTLNSDDIDEGTTNKYADANATNQGNTFNGNSQLVKTTADGKLPVLDGSNLTGLSSGATTLNGLTDVTITTPSDNQFLRHNGTVFVNESVTILSLGNYTTSLPTTGWTGASAPYSYAATVSGILSTDTPTIDLDLSSSAYGDISDIETAYSNVYRAATSTDTITFYASEVPTIAVPLMVKVVR